MPDIEEGHSAEEAVVDIDTELDVDLDDAVPSGSRKRSRATSRDAGGRGRGRGKRQPVGGGKARKSVASTSASSKANSILSLLDGSGNVQQKQAPSAVQHRCWSWDHWRPENPDVHGSEAITPSRYDDLKAVKPKLVCVHCEKAMRWDPSTNRKEHLLLK
jgi:hypothetical protein